MPDTNENVDFNEDIELPGPEGIDPYWDSLISNPELREAYNAAERAGLPTNKAHVIARIEVFGKEYVRDQFGDEIVDKVNSIELNIENKDQKDTEPSDREGVDNQTEETQDDKKGQYTFDDWNHGDS